MAKKLSKLSIFLSVVVVLALVYFFRPQTFSFLTEGFTDDMFDSDPEGFKGGPGKKETTPPPTGATATGVKPPKCVPGCVP
jgi:hypothetical protein